MRTDTTTFRRRVRTMVRALGIKSARSKIVALRIAGGIRHGSCNPYANGRGHEGRDEIASLDLELDVFGIHVVRVVVDGEFAFSATTDDRVLVDVEPTPGQVAMRDRLHDLMVASLHAADDARIAWESSNGSSDDDGPVSSRETFVDADPSTVAARAAYEAAVEESLALNRFAHVAYTDPLLHEEWSWAVKCEDGGRPRGTYANREMALGWFARRAANDETAATCAA